MHLGRFVGNKRTLKEVYKLKLAILFKFRTVLWDAQEKDKDKLSRRNNLWKNNKCQLLRSGTGGNCGKMNRGKLSSGWTDVPSCRNGKSGCLCVKNISTSTTGCAGLASCKLRVFNNINLIVTQWFTLIHRNFYGLFCLSSLIREKNIQFNWGGYLNSVE